MTFKLFLDPGHGGSDPGTEGNGLEEKNITLEISKEIYHILTSEYSDVSVKMSRTGDTYPTLAERTNEANQWGADFFLSIHINSGGGEGYEDYIDTGLSDSSRTGQIRNDIHSEVIKVNGLGDRGEKKADYYVLRNTIMPAVLTENGFIDNAGDAAKMKDPSWITAVARGHVNGLVKAFGLKDQSGSGTFLIRVKADSLWYYNKPDWHAKAGIVHKGDVFTVVDILTVEGSEMYKLKSGNYITANPQYVEKVQG
ncbi:N-acetylmuramoyl-L-alanine amidase [Scopulibacillus daqui]|uniref:N-acetylmuramoyl-L-alanine amidase n=1 Tax=Scopulibacillus daqui TaxID=1469162 RepID=A0ABS2Q363_9BACL|nr:N-acetylmuramoyl-L-alanine amidase [Scopulibacillus daqui]MBM7646375.1 N-acetylmuramoyl-L-alanine amidase [Scopulibacillus daqui]